MSVTVKSNLLAFQEMLQTPEDTPRSRSRGKSTSGRIEDFACSSEASGTASSNTASNSAGEAGRSSSMSTVHSNGSRDNTPTPSNRKTSPGTSNSSSKGKASKINRAFNRFLHKPKSLMNVDALDGDAQLSCHHSGSHSLHLYSSSNPDLLRGDNSTTAANSHDDHHRTEYPEHVLKVYKSDQVNTI